MTKSAIRIAFKRFYLNLIPVSSPTSTNKRIAIPIPLWLNAYGTPFCILKHNFKSLSKIFYFFSLPITPDPTIEFIKLKEVPNMPEFENILHFCFLSVSFFNRNIVKKLKKLRVDKKNLNYFD